MVTRKEPEAVEAVEVSEPATEVAEPVTESAVLPTSGAVVLDPTVLNPQSMQPPPHVGVKLVWDNPAQDPNARKHIGDDPDGTANASRFSD